MISLLLPSRKRPEIFSRMLKSVKDTAKGEVDIVVRMDYDDDSVYPEDLSVTYIAGPRLREMTRYWNHCFDACLGDIVCQANDDMVFLTPGWDAILEKAYAEVPDHIMLAHGNDVFGHGSAFGPHAFVHSRWVEALGYFIPPYFCSDFGDAWINELADRIGRRRYLPFDIEHHHFSLGLCEQDEVTAERLSRHTQDDPGKLYYSEKMTHERVADAEKLAKLCDPKQVTTGWVVPRPGRAKSVGKCPRCESLSTVMVSKTNIFCNCCGFEFPRPTR